VKKIAINLSPLPLTSTPNPSASPTTPASQTPTQARNLKQGDTGNDVKALQIILNFLGYTVAPQGPGSLNNETTYFGNLTRQALIKFQLANNIQPPDGFFGPITRDALIQKIISLLLTS
jgi:peptidoglycan hydrolase-like protein with peptidoglycan-binding domain